MRMTLLNTVFGSVSFGLSAGCGTCLPNGFAVATHSLGDWTESAEGDPDSLWGRSPHLAEAGSGFWKGERASEGRGRFERGTLNADRKANREGAALFNGFFSCSESQKASSETRCLPFGAQVPDLGCQGEYLVCHRPPQGFASP